MRHSAFCILHSALIVVAALAAMAASAATTIFDFETEAEREAVAQLSAQGFHVCVTNAFATSGERALHFAVPSYSYGAPTNPGGTLENPVTDWSGYDRLCIDLVGLNGRGGKLKLAIPGPEGAFRDSTPIPEGGYRQWIVPLEYLGKAVSPTNVAHIRFATYNFTGSDIEAVIDRIALLRKGEAPPAPDGPCVERDIRPLARADRAAARARAEAAEHAADVARFREACRAAGCAAAQVMLLGKATSMQKVLPRGPFKASALGTDGIFVRLARCERESAQLLVVADGRDLKGVKVQVEGDLNQVESEKLKVESEGGTFAASNIVCGVTGYVRTECAPPYGAAFTEALENDAGYTRKVRTPYIGWWPDPILEYVERVDVRDGDVQSFWIRVHCPEGQPAGTYGAALVVSAEGVEPVSVPLRVRVNDFAIGSRPALPVVVSFLPAVPWLMRFSPEWGRQHAADAPIPSWGRHKAEWVDFLADYFISYDSLYHGNGANYLDGALQLKREGRLGLLNLGYWLYPKSTEKADIAAWRESAISRLADAYEKAKAAGIADHLYTYGCDEVPSQYHAAMKAAVEEVKKALPGVPIMTTAKDGAYGVGTPLGGIDWFCPTTFRYDPAKATIARKEGRQVWWYVCSGPKPPYANMFIESQAIEGRLLMGAMVQRMRPDGFLYYQTVAWSSPRCLGAAPFTDWNPMSYEDWHGDGQWVCAGPDGIPVPTIRLENFRDGLEDYAYAKLLERKLKELGGDCSQMTTNVNCSQIANINKILPTSPTPSLPEAEATAPRQPSNSQTIKPSNRASWAQRARKALAVPREVMDSMTNYTDDPAVLYRWRDEMADLIEEGAR